MQTRGPNTRYRHLVHSDDLSQTKVIISLRSFANEASFGLEMVRKLETETRVLLYCNLLGVPLSSNHFHNTDEIKR